MKRKEKNVVVKNRKDFITLLKKEYISEMDDVRKEHFDEEEAIKTWTFFYVMKEDHFLNVWLEE